MEPTSEYTPRPSEPFASPTGDQNASPTASPTPKKCVVCYEKERLIKQLEKTIKTQDLLIAALENNDKGTNGRNGKQMA